MDRREYEAKKEAERIQQKAKREHRESEVRARRDREREGILSKKWFFCHPDKIVRYTGYLQLFTAVLAIATAALVGATIYSAIVLHSTDVKVGEQVKALGRQLTVMENGQRPWISVEVQLERQPEIFPDKGVGFVLKTSIKNVGKSPAISVSRFVASHIPIGPEQGSFLDRAKEKCPRTTMDGFASILFPGEDSPQNLISGLTREQLKLAQPEQPKTGPRNTKAFNAIIMVCVNYRSESGGDVHQTAAILDMEKLLPTDAMSLTLLGQYAD
jgi:hypothetical protein